VHSPDWRCGGIVNWRHDKEDRRNRKEDIEVVHGDLRSGLNLQLGREFYSRSPIVVARDLIGKKLVRHLSGNTQLSGMIVETEAYGGSGDPASHAYLGKTSRNEVMFGQPGHCYVYFTYGFHHCLNFVTGRFQEEEAGAVLVRAIQPLSGIPTMEALRRTNDIYNIASGPGKLCQALSIDLRLNGADATATDSDVLVEMGDDLSMGKIIRSSRIGIKKATEKKWRFFFADNLFVSRARLIYP
jgi:DNA-3-methyladenine glycosylase